MHILTFLHKCNWPCIMKSHWILNSRAIYIQECHTFYCKHCGDPLFIFLGPFAGFLNLPRIVTWLRMSPLCFLLPKSGFRSSANTWITLISFRACGSAFFSVGLRLFLWLFESAFYDKNSGLLNWQRSASSIVRIFSVPVCLSLRFQGHHQQHRFLRVTF